MVGIRLFIKDQLTNFVIQMTKWGPLVAAAAFAATPTTAAVLVYELTLATDAPYTAFGGGSAGDLIIGTFGFDDNLVGSPGLVSETRAQPTDPILSENSFFLGVDLHGTTFSTATAGTIQDNALRFDGGPLVDVFFDLTNTNGDRLQVRTDSDPPPGESEVTFWLATEGSDGSSVGGEAVPIAVVFSLVPEPTTTALAALSALALCRRRRN